MSNENTAMPEQVDADDHTNDHQYNDMAKNSSQHNRETSSPNVGGRVNRESPSQNNNVSQPSSLKNKHGASDQSRRIKNKHHRKRKIIRQKRIKHRIMFFFIQTALIAFLVVSIALILRAMNTVTDTSKGSSWAEELKQGNYESAAEKFTILATDAYDHVLNNDLSTKDIMNDFNAALPYLKKEGYTLTMLDIQIGLPPKLIPHFYHDDRVKFNLQQALTDLDGNSIGIALMIALSKVSELQKKVSVSGMQFNHIMVELGPIPSVTLQYKNPEAIKGYIHRH